MTVRARMRRFRILGALLALVAGGCNGDGDVNIIAQPTPVQREQVSGLVELPDGQLSRSRSLLQRVASALLGPVRALTGAIEPVGPGVEVQLVLVTPEDAQDGTIPTDLPVLASVSTNENGQYFALFLPEGTDASTCRYMVQVGNADDGTLTRAFVYDTAGPVDINFRSEAAVRLILDSIVSGEADSLCDFDSEEIGNLYDAIVAAPGTVGGDTIEELNENGTNAAAADPTVQAVIAEATGNPPPPTVTGRATASATPTGEGTSTPTVPVTVAASSTPSRTRTSGPTSTVRPSNTTGATRTSSPSPTGSVAVPTNTPVAPTNTPPSPSATPMPPTNTVPPAGTATPTGTGTLGAPTETPTSPEGTVTATQTTEPTTTPTIILPPEVNLTTVVGTAGMIVSVPVVLVGTGLAESVEELVVGTAIVAVANDIEYDSTLVDVVQNLQGAPDCTLAPSLAASKMAIAALPAIAGLPAGHQVLRVGVIGADNNSPIPPGPLYSCRFAIDGNAPAGPITLDNTPDASDPNGDPVVVTGRDGIILTSAAPAALNLSSTTTPAGQTATISATLAARGETLSALATDISFDASVMDVALDNQGNPDCTVDDAIGLASDLDKEVFATVLSGSAATALGASAGTSGSGQILRVGVVAKGNNESVPDGATFHCRFEVAPGTGAQVVSLSHSPEGSTPDGMSVGLSGGAGTITIP